MREKSVAVVFGTRPEVIKLAPVVHRLGAHARLVHTGQHYSPALATDFLEELTLGPPHVRLEVGGVPRARQVGEATVRLDEHFGADPPVLVVVQGDTNSALAGALAANGRERPLVHVEAGLRSFDRRMPEEHNRVLTDHLADLCCAPTETSRANLLAERIPDERIAVTGNTVVDAVRLVLPDPSARESVLAAHGLVPGSYVLSTLHRPENVDRDTTLRTILEQLERCPLPVLLPLHPRTAHRIAAFGLDRSRGRIRVVSPVGYREFLALAAEAAFLISDSGGVQEEASALKQRVLVVRRSTERPEVLGTFATLVDVGPAVGDTAIAWARDAAERRRELAAIASPYGDGDAAGRALAAIEARVGPL